MSKSLGTSSSLGRSLFDMKCILHYSSISFLSIMSFKLLSEKYNRCGFSRRSLCSMSEFAILAHNRGVIVYNPPVGLLSLDGRPRVNLIEIRIGGSVSCGQ